MTFIHGYLLGGLLLAGVPVLLHLIMRQKPRRLPFPAFRFLAQKRRINQRKLRLQHLLFLLLRVLVVAALCLALARPRLFINRTLPLGGERPVAAVLVFDTSASMDYTANGQTRLEDARQRALEFLAELNPDSQVAVLDSGDDSADQFLSRAAAVARVEALHVRPGGGALNRPVERALDLLQKAAEGEDSPPRLVYVFSDRTRACWDPSASARVNVPPGVQAVFVDVGVETPRDLAIDGVEVDPPVVAPGGKVEIRVSVRATGGDHDNELSCQLDPEPDPQRQPDRRAIRRGAGQSDEIVFERTAPAGDGVRDVPYQVTVKLGTRDALPFNNTRYATFVVRAGRQLLTVVENNPKDARIWKAALDATGRFRGTVQTLDEAKRLTPRQFGDYKVVCLFQVSAVPDEFWKKLADFVAAGGGLALVPGGVEAKPHLKEWNAAAGKVGLQPAPLAELADPPDNRPVHWSPFSGGHPLTAPFLKWSRTADPDFDRPELRPFVRRYWKTGKLAAGARAVATFDDADKSLALGERELGKGKVVQFTTPLDARLLDPTRPQTSPQWTNYWQTSFGLVLVDRVCLYLAGEASLPELNFRCGQVPQVVLPTPPEPPYTLDGPDLALAEKNLPSPAEKGVAGRVAVGQVLSPGHYTVQDGKGRLTAGFSVNVRPEESDLSRVPVEELESALGPGAVLQVGRSVSLRDALQSHRPPPLELLPHLMLLLLLVLVAESLLANKFYRRAAGADAPNPDASAAPPSPAAPARAAAQAERVSS